LVLVKGDRQRGSRVNPTTHRVLLWLKKIARWDLRLTQSKGQVAHENRIFYKKKERKEKKKRSEVFG
jgi:hypothetical protein